jgi:hypothetical protein
LLLGIFTIIRNLLFAVAFIIKPNKSNPTMSLSGKPRL